MKKNNGPLTSDQAITGASVCLSNATELLKDAMIFLKAEKYSKSFAFCEIAKEELGKISILMQISLTTSLKLKMLEILVKKDKKFERLKKKSELQILWDAFYQHDAKVSLALMKVAQEKLGKSGQKVFGRNLEDMNESQKVLVSFLLVYANPSVLEHMNKSEIEKKNDCLYVDYSPSTQKWTEPNQVIDEIEANTQIMLTTELLGNYSKALGEIIGD